MTLNIRQAFNEFQYALGLVFDPERDKDELPSAYSPVFTVNQPTRTAKSDQSRVHIVAGRKYMKSEEIDGSGNICPVFDTKGVASETDVPIELTRHDRDCYLKYSQQEKYKFFDYTKYRVIKEVAFSKSVEGKPMTPKQASKLDRVIELKGCGERRLKDYFKCMNEAQQLYLTTPLG